MSSHTPQDLQRRYEDLLEHLPAGVVVHGLDGRILSANPRAWELLGRPEEELIGTESSVADWSFLRTDNTVMPESEYPVNQVLRTGASLSDLVVGVPATTPEPLRWLLCTAYPEYDEKPDIQRVVVCFTDCSQLKKAERRLEKSEERLRLVLQGSTDASWDWNLVTGDVYYSDRWWEMFGYRPDEQPGDANTWTAMMHPDDQGACKTFLADLLAAPRSTYSVEFRMRHRDGHYVPVLSRGFVSLDSTGKAVRLSGTNTDLTERRLAEQHIYELAYFDHLTGLPNRRFLTDELDKVLARSERSGHLGALLFLDLDNFKLLNDTLGHDAGDMLLRFVAQRLTSALRHSDQVARLGGDEFVVVLEDLGQSMDEAVAEASHVIAKMLAVLDRPHDLAGRLVTSTASVGVTLFDGTMTGIEVLLKQADLAMYRAKSAGRHLARFFDPSMQASADRQAALEDALRDGLSLGQFVLFCQPQFNIHQQLIGAEVLLRWRREDGSVVGPVDFIGLAEESGLIIPLGRHVLDESCRALARWTTDTTLRKLKLAVNVSVHQLREPAFATQVAGILADTGAPAAKLCLELTESAFAEDTQATIVKMQQLRDLGLGFSLDDFGTGYSSLAYLKRFPLTALKIDRSFVHDVHVDPNAGPIIEAIIALARKLKLDIVAEGVEDEVQRRFLTKGGCYALQGYLLGMPMPIGDFERIYSAGGVGHA